MIDIATNFPKQNIELDNAKQENSYDNSVSIFNMGAFSSTPLSRNTNADNKTEKIDKKGDVGTISNSAAEDIIIDAYIKKILKVAYEKFEIDSSTGIDKDVVGGMIRSSEAYLSSLISFDEYRKFIGIILLTLRGNYTTMNSHNARNFIKILDNFNKSDKKTIDNKKLIKSLYSAQLLSLGYNDAATSQ